VKEPQGGGVEWSNIGGTSQLRKFRADLHKFHSVFYTRFSFKLGWHNEFLSHIMRITGDEILVSFVINEIKEQSNQWLHIYSPNKPNKFKYILFICQ
jgi:hypothetical protein